MAKTMNKNFSILLGGQLVSQIGDRFYMLALSFWVLRETGSPAKMGTVLAAALIPSLALGLISGVWIDRCNRKMIIVGTDFFRGVIVTCVVALHYLGMLDFGIILVSQVLLSINSAFFDPAIPAVIPQIVDEADLTTANSKHQFVQGISTIVGPILGGVAVASFGCGIVFIANALSFFISGVFEMFLRIPDIKTGGGESDTGKRDIFTEMKEGYRHIFSDRALAIILVMVGAIHFFVGSVEVAMPVIASFSSGQGMESGARNLGFFQTCFGIGAIAMASILSMKSISGKESRILFGSVAMIGVLFILAAIPVKFAKHRVYMYLPVFLLLGCFIMSAGTAFKSLLQKRVDNRLAGRVFGVAGSIGNGSVPAAMIIYGFLFDRFPIHCLLPVSGLVLLLLSLISHVLFQGDEYAEKTEHKRQTGIP